MGSKLRIGLSLLEKALSLTFTMLNRIYHNLKTMWIQISLVFLQPADHNHTISYDNLEFTFTNGVARLDWLGNCFGCGILIYLK